MLTTETVKAILNREPTDLGRQILLAVEHAQALREYSQQLMATNEPGALSVAETMMNDAKQLVDEATKLAQAPSQPGL